MEDAKAENWAYHRVPCLFDNTRQNIYHESLESFSTSSHKFPMHNHKYTINSRISQVKEQGSQRVHSHYTKGLQTPTLLVV